jgi:hypothetical protein
MAATDTFASNTNALSTPPTKAFAITPNDSAELAFVTRSIWVGVGGDIVAIYRDDSAAVTLKNVPSGSRISGRFKQVNSTNTTATNLIGEY